jgi:MFS family permease
MYAPSVITGFLIRKVGISGMMISGLVIYVLCIAIAFAGHDLINYWVSLIFLGLGWNFLFIGGTSLLPLSYRPAERFRVQALNDFVVFGSQAIASLSAGWLVFAIGWESMLIVVIPIIVLQGGIVLRSAGQP